MTDFYENAFQRFEIQFLYEKEQFQRQITEQMSSWTGKMIGQFRQMMNEVVLHRLIESTSTKTDQTIQPVNDDPISIDPARIDPSSNDPTNSHDADYDYSDCSDSDESVIFEEEVPFGTTVEIATNNGTNGTVNHGQQLTTTITSTCKKKQRLAQQQSSSVPYPIPSSSSSSSPSLTRSGYRVGHHSYFRTVFRNCFVPNCSRKLSTRKDYEQHLVGHGVCPYPCMVQGCGMAFNTNPAIENHIRTVHRDLGSGSLFACFYCSKLFKSYPSVTTHLRREHERGQYGCISPGCDFTGELSKHVYEHYIKSHKPYICDYAGCGHQCISSSKLINHQYKHLPHLRPYRCLWPGCTQTVSRKSNLIFHINSTHFGGKQQQPENVQQYIQVQEDQLLKEPIRFSNV